MIKRMVLDEGGGSWQNCRARRVSTSLGEFGLWGLGSWEGLRVRVGKGGSWRVFEVERVLEGL